MFAHTVKGTNIIVNNVLEMAFVNTRGLIDVMNFNRCTGHLSQIKSIEPETPGNIPWYVGAAFSPNGNYLYVSSNGNNSALFKYDLTLPDPSIARDTIWEFTDSTQPGGLLKLAPDGKIYMSNVWNNGVQFNYPYQDSMFNYVNMNLSVINDPDQPGLACNFQPYSFYLGGKRTYYGLPNNPDYEMGPLAGSSCDTLTGASEVFEFENVSKAFGDRLLIDDHGAPIDQAVWRLYRQVLERIGPVATLIERDNQMPAFDVLLAEAQQASTEALRQVSADIAHDLKTPITRLRFRAEDLADGVARDAMAEDLTEMERMLDQTLSFLRGDRSDEELKPLDIVAILGTCTFLFLGILSGRDLFSVFAKAAGSNSA